MKFKYGDLLYHIPTSQPYYAGATVVQVLDYDKKRKKYRCVCFDTYIIYESYFIVYICEEELDYLNTLTDTKSLYIDGKPPFPINIDDTYVDICDDENGKCKLIRKK